MRARACREKRAAGGRGSVRAWSGSVSAPNRARSAGRGSRQSAWSRGRRRRMEPRRSVRAEAKATELAATPKADEVEAPAKPKPKPAKQKAADPPPDTWEFPTEGSAIEVEVDTGSGSTTWEKATVLAVLIDGTFQARIKTKVGRRADMLSGSSGSLLGVRGEQGAQGQGPGAKGQGVRFRVGGQGRGQSTRSRSSPTLGSPRAAAVPTRSSRQQPCRTRAYRPPAHRACQRQRVARPARPACAMGNAAHSRRRLVWPRPARDQRRNPPPLYPSTPYRAPEPLYPLHPPDPPHPPRPLPSRTTSGRTGSHGARRGRTGGDPAPRLGLGLTLTQTQTLTLTLSPDPDPNPNPSPPP